MKPETIDTITRHLKGIVAALEKEKEPRIIQCEDRGKIDGFYVSIYHLSDGIKIKSEVEAILVDSYYGSDPASFRMRQDMIALVPYGIDKYKFEDYHRRSFKPE